MAGTGEAAPAEEVIAEAEAVAPPETAAEPGAFAEPRAIADGAPEGGPAPDEPREPESIAPSQLNLGVIEDLVEALAEPLPLRATQRSWDEDTTVRRRLASIYLRTRSLAAARVEFESLGGRNLLEGRGLLELAEVRWRTGDRAGAGQAAGSYLDAGGDDGLGFAIVAEAAAAAGRLDEARGHLAEAAGRLSDLVAAYAGMRSLVVPAPAVAEPPPAESAETPASPAPPEPAVAPVDPEVATASAVLESGEPLLASVHFGIALRTAPGLAQAVLDAIGDRHDAALEIVRGDALRLLGRDDEASRAYRAAASALAGDEGHGNRP
jgi:hypothetical protein